MSDEPKEESQPRPQPRTEQPAPPPMTVADVQKYMLEHGTAAAPVDPDAPPPMTVADVEKMMKEAGNPPAETPPQPTEGEPEQQQRTQGENVPQQGATPASGAALRRPSGKPEQGGR